MTFPARSIASSGGLLSADPGCSTTPTAPSCSPEWSATFSASSDLSRSSGSSLAQLSRYTAWITSASTFESFMAAWKASTSSSLYTRARHARGLWLKIWIERQARSSPRFTAFAGPPAGETWAPISIG